MLSARRKSDGQEAVALSESKANGPFACLECDREVVLRTGSVRVWHFSHKIPTDCSFGTGESDAHRKCKLDIYQALLREPGVTDVALERSLATNRPDVSARINGVLVAIEVQLSAISMETIIRRTERYARQGICVLWLPQWSPYLDGIKYSPRLWEKWIHAAYFGRVYYWIKGLQVARYNFEPHIKHMPLTSWFGKDGNKMTGGGYSRKSKRYRSPVRAGILNLAQDFAAQERPYWRGSDFEIPSAKIFMES